MSGSKAYPETLQPTVELRPGLTSPIACITGPAGGAGNYTVAIAWRGRQKLSNPTRSTCGSDSGNYDEGTELNVRRRVVVIDTFIGLPV